MSGSIPCNLDCFNCIFPDCIYDGSTVSSKRLSSRLDTYARFVRSSDGFLQTSCYSDSVRVYVHSPLFHYKESVNSYYSSNRPARLYYGLVRYRRDREALLRYQRNYYYKNRQARLDYQKAYNARRRAVKK